MNNYALAVTGIAITWWAILAYSLESDRSRYRNCYFLFFALLFTLCAGVFLAGDRGLEFLVGVIVIIGVVLLLVPVFLIHNGIVMYRREGHSLANLLSLLFGIVIGVGEVATIYILLTGTQTELAMQYVMLSKFSQFVSVSVIYVSMCFVIFMIYSLFLMIIPRRRDFDYVVIHGAGLLEGSKVSKLLADRIDKAIDVYHKDPTPPMMIPSGGKGSDESLSEAEAMAEYMKEHGIPADKILLEDRSTTTLENLQNSKALIDSRGPENYIALVTSNYHVYRALRYCRRIGLKCTGIGSRVALYFWPSALIREFIAIHAEAKHLISFIAGWLICLAFVLL